MELNKIQRFGEHFALLPEHAAETPYGWLIPWAQSDYRFTKEVKLGGNAPFFVDRFSGAVCQVSLIHHDFHQWLSDYALRQGYVARAEPAASPNGGPAERSGDSGVGEGPPSVS
jgi:hypothetical protein